MVSSYLLHRHSCTPILFRTVPPPCIVSKSCHHFNYSAFFFAALFGFAAVVAEASAVTGFLEEDLFNLALIVFLFLDTPNDPLNRFPFAVFISSSH